MKDKVQRLGRFLSSMVMPNIGAFIAWGFITALFIPDGWFPNEKFALLVDPMIKYLLPILIAYTGGRMINGVRGGVVAATASLGVISGSDVPQFLGAMIVGPLAGYLSLKMDEFLKPKTPAGFEMLVNNFSLGFLGLILALFSQIIIGPVVSNGIIILGNGVKVIVDANLLPLASIIVEPAKILFLNNAINHGVFGPLGIEQVTEMGKSIFYLIETNPGPGLGVLLACMFFAKGAEKQTAPGAIIIHFFGGIHEIYFPYILMQPLLVLAVILGGAAGVLTFQLLGAGLVAAASPGSILALMVLAPRGGLIPVLAGVLVSTVVSFLVASTIYKTTSAKSTFEESKDSISELKENKKEIKKIVFACDAGMGSSAMGAKTLENKFKKAGIDIKVENYALDEIPADTDLVVTHNNFKDRVYDNVKNAEVIFINNFVGAPEYDKLVERFKK
ncbi:MAG: PTS mannitol transporter subunit IICB [Erysipelotrichaceae bacterium]|nr:PTS mannitol transporter subunit IICB [Erysipelotrichaceae bacterium]